MIKRDKRLLFKRRLLLISIGLILVLGGCSDKPFSAEDEAKWFAQIEKQVNNKVEPQEITNTLQRSIGKIDSKELQSDAVNHLIMAIYNFSDAELDKAIGLQKTFQTYAELGIDFNDATAYDQIEDETLKAYLKELQKRYYFILYNQGEYEAHPNLRFVLDNFKEYMEADLLTMTEFSLDEQLKPFYNKSSNTFNLDIVRERILKLESDLKTYSGSKYYEGFVSMKNYYRQVYFGTNNTLLVDEYKKVKPSILRHYHDTVENYPNSELAKDVTLLLEQLSQTDNVVSDNIYVNLLEVTGMDTMEKKESGLQ